MNNQTIIKFGLNKAEATRVMGAHKDIGLPIAFEEYNVDGRDYFFWSIGGVIYGKNGFEYSGLSISPAPVPAAVPQPDKLKPMYRITDMAAIFLCGCTFGVLVNLLIYHIAKL